MTLVKYLLYTYIASFVLFALIRLTTGISIKRLGYLCVRGISFSPKAGVHINIGKVGFLLHRPSFARPGWINFYVSGLDISIDPVELEESKAHPQKNKKHRSAKCTYENKEWTLTPPDNAATRVARFFMSITRFIDFAIYSTTVDVKDVNTFILAQMVFQLDLRSHLANRKHTVTGTLYENLKLDGELPAFFTVIFRELLVKPSGDDYDDEQTEEILDSVLLEVRGFLKKKDLSLKRLAVNLKLGRINILVDKLMEMKEAVKKVKKHGPGHEHVVAQEKPAVAEEDAKCAEEAAQVKANFATLLIRTIREVEVHVAQFGVYHIPASLFNDSPTDKLSFAIMAKDFNLDLRRLNPKSPAFRMYFDSDDTAHQTIFSVISVVVGLSVNKDVPEELVYVPMVTLNSKTNMFSRTLSILSDSGSVSDAGGETTSDTDSDDAAAPIYSGQLITGALAISSPTVDLQTHHVPLLLTALNRSSKSKPPKVSDEHFFMKGLKPATNLKLTIEEPAARVLVTRASKDNKLRKMVISSCEAIVCNMHSSHENLFDSDQETKYTLQTSFKVVGYSTWYRSPEGDRHDILDSQILQISVNADMAPKLLMKVDGQLLKARFDMTEAEVVRGLREVVQNVRRNDVADQELHAEAEAKAKAEIAHGHDLESEDEEDFSAYDPTLPKKPNALRKLPCWLRNVNFECCESEIAVGLLFHDDTYKDVSTLMVIGVEKCILDYKNGVTQDGLSNEAARQFALEHSDQVVDDTDDRRFVVSVKNVLAKESISSSAYADEDDKRFDDREILTLPSLDMAVFTTSNKKGPYTQTSLMLPKVLMQYSAHVHWFVTVHLGLLLSIFHEELGTGKGSAGDNDEDANLVEPDTNMSEALEALQLRKKTNKFKKLIRERRKRRKVVRGPKEEVTVNLAIAMMRIKWHLPHDFWAMLELDTLTLDGRDLQKPVVLAKYLRLYGTSPTVEDYWNRILVFRGMRVRADVPLIKETLASTERVHEEPTPCDERDDAVTAFIDGMQLCIPNQFICYTILDNILSGVKSIAHISQRLRLNTSDVVVWPKVMKPRAIPKVRIHTPRLLVIVEDDPFESQLNLIFQVGYKEQQTRLEKEKAFEEYADRIMASRLPKKRPTRVATEEEIHKEGGSHHHNLTSIGTGLKDVFHKKHKNDTSDSQNSSSEGYKDTSTVSIDQAEEELRRNFATSWIINFNAASDERKLAVSDLYGTVWGDEQIAEDTAKNENILEYSDNPPLMSMYHKDVDWVLDRVQFPIAEIPDFLYDVGKGQPKDTVYTIMLPFFWNVQMGEWRINLRDYPLPLVHFPPLHPSQEASGPAVSFHGTFIVGEMLSEGIEYVRRIKVPLAPFVHPDEIAPSTFMMEVFRTVTSVKVFTNLTFEGHSISPTRINWGSSMSPAISAGFGAIDTFSKPPADLSPKPGFWDKARLMAHGRFKLKWDKSDIHFVMKSSKNPYAVLGDDAGLVWVWRNHVVWDINGEDNPKEFMRVDSEEFMLAVPNLGLSEREYLMRAFNAKDYGSQGQFLKVIMKVVGKVRWLAGVAFERDDPDHPGERTDKFKPHYDVITKNSAEINDPHWDAFRGFRSEYIHLALSVRNPQGRDWINAQEPAQQAYNAIHLSPETFAHFKKWWHMFDSSTSMPARHGRLWMSPEERRELKKAPKKVSFGKSMHTVKYMIQLSQLFICHLYRHPENEDEASRHTRSAATGIKLRTDAYMMELHQRREPVKGSDVWKMKLNLGEIDFQSCDIRVISAVFKEESAHGVLARHMGLKDDVSSLGSSTNNTNSQQSGTTNTGSSRVGTFQISDGDFSWIDMDDFVEINESTPDGKSPEVAVIPMLYTPRWTYFRETDHEHKEYMTDSRGNKYRRFGDETNVLDGFLGKIAPQLTQIRLFEEREKDLAEQIKTHEAMLDSLKHGGNEAGQAVKERIASVEETLFNLKTRYHVISHTCLGIRAPGESECGPNSISERIKNELNDVNETKFNNRFIVHNVHLKWNNIVRNAMFRYLHRVEERKKLTYFMSRGAVKRIEDLLKELDQTMASDHYTSEQKQERAKEVTTNLLQVAAHMIDNRATCQERVDTMEEALYNTYSDPNITIDNTYLVKLVSPQVQLMSEQNPDKVVILTAPNISLRITSAIDESDIDADFKGVVEKRHGVQLEHANFFVLDKEAVMNRSAFLMNNNNYGCHRNSLWPPWLAIEMCYDATALRDDVVVSDATVGLRYDKPNMLRLKSLRESAREARCTEDEEKEAFNRFNRIEVDFPKVTAYCTSEQYFAVYTIAMDLLLYSEPIKESNKKAMDRMLMTFDPKRLHSAPETIECLQSEMRRLRKIRELMQTQKDGKKDVRQIDVELASGYLELFTMMAATTKILVTSKETEDFTDTMKWAIGSDEIIWHLLEDDHTPLVDFGMASPSFVRFQEPNGANTNCMEIQMMQGFNLKPNAPYPEMLGPFLDGDANKTRRNAKLKKLDEPALVYAAWKMLAPIGGIPVMELLEVQLQPLKLALDQDTAEKMFSYVFPKNNDSPFNVHDPTKHKTMTDAVAIYADSDNGSDLTGGNESLSSSLASRLDASPNSRYQVVGVKMPGGDAESSSGVSSTRKSIDSDSSDESTGKFNIFRNRRRQDDPDEGTQMMKRASEYTSIVDIRLHSAVICISLKGHGTKALADVHNFVFTIPDLVYQNKTWTNLDLADQVKKDVIRALLQHTGSLLRNFIKPHRRDTNSAPLRQISEYTKFTAVDDLRADKDDVDHQNGRAGLGSRAGTFTQPSSASVSRKPSTDSSLRKVATSKSKESNGKEHRKSGFFHRLKESL